MKLANILTNLKEGSKGLEVAKKDPSDVIINFNSSPDSQKLTKTEVYTEGLKTTTLSEDGKKLKVVEKLKNGEFNETLFDKNEQITQESKYKLNKNNQRINIATKQYEEGKLVFEKSHQELFNGIWDVRIDYKKGEKQVTHLATSKNHSDFGTVTKQIIKLDKKNKPVSEFKTIIAPKREQYSTSPNGIKDYVDDIKTEQSVWTTFSTFDKKGKKQSVPSRFELYVEYEKDGVLYTNGKEGFVLMEEQNGRRVKYNREIVDGKVLLISEEVTGKAGRTVTNYGYGGSPDGKPTNKVVADSISQSTTHYQRSGNGEWIIVSPNA